MGLKEATKDVHFSADSSEYNVIKKLNSGSQFRVDLFRDGYIFALQLPDDFRAIATKHKADYKYLKIRILHPIDIVVSKTAHLHQRDVEDIQTVIKSKNVEKSRLIKRMADVKKTIPNSADDFEMNCTLVLKEYF